ncbi:Tyrosine recombinase xerC [Planococcus antarcticus DSM 14505]|uniref:Recombinase XerC n=1 Tax=Planococcus antarcticus DSM 14505 TaxID=1185653 RepID=A0A1C7DI57_9BACL|nr:site-specific integrase [Planococcus antarcticus]ANU11104.1 recombinase XerC [Planococcus antarcticus DSM 14505]EIM05181.1 Tyrosine recombinase xerC [Planococcus antarcticus DSM 14505]
MPYGYEKFRLDNGISPNTVVHEVQLIRSLFAFLRHTYKKPVEPHNIRPSDIQQFLMDQHASGIKDSTLNRKLIYIRRWFDYMWQIGRIPNDFMPKFKFSEKLDLTPSDIYLDYEDLLKKKESVLEADQLSLNAKILFILYLRGLRLRDMVTIDVENFDDRSGKLTLAVEKKDGYQCLLGFNGKEIPVMLEGIERAVFRGTPYLLSSKVKNEYTMFQMGSLSDYTEALSSFVGTPMRSGDIRFAYVHYLYSVKHKNLEEIQEILGVSLDSASRILKDSLVRLKRGTP